MNELPKVFENAKAGDFVFTTRNGWSVITAIIDNPREVYPVEIYGSDECTLDGRYSTEEKAPSAWPADKVPQYYLDLFPRPKKKVKKVIERQINIYKTNVGETHINKATADRLASYDCIECVKLTGEYEVEE